MDHPAPSRGHVELRLIFLFLVVQGIESGFLKSMAASPFPSSGHRTLAKLLMSLDLAWKI
jgi:hypothetical protein